jgi:hypothetical protein
MMRMEIDLARSEISHRGQFSFMVPFVAIEKSADSPARFQAAEPEPQAFMVPSFANSKIGGSYGPLSS